MGILAALDLQLEPVVYHLNDGLVERPVETLGSSFHEAPYGIYETAAGHLALSLSPVAKISAMLGDPPELAEFLDPAVKFTRFGRTAKELVTLFREHGIWCAPVNDYDAVFADPVVAHLHPVLEFEHPTAGKVKVLRHPLGV